MIYSTCKVHFLYAVLHVYQVVVTKGHGNAITLNDVENNDPLFASNRDGKCVTSKPPLSMSPTSS